jgi:hypothetical protein
MTEFKHFRSTVTGKVGTYPENFGDLFPDTFEEVDSNAVDCVDCWLKPEADVVPDDDFPDPVVVSTTDKNKDK